MFCLVVTVDEESTLSPADIQGTELSVPFGKHTLPELCWWLFCRGTASYCRMCRWTAVAAATAVHKEARSYTAVQLRDGPMQPQLSDANAKKSCYTSSG